MPKERAKNVSGYCESGKTVIYLGEAPWVASVYTRKARRHLNSWLSHIIEQENLGNFKRV